MKEKLTVIPAMYYVIAALCYVATLFTDAMRPGLAGAALMALVFAYLAFSKSIRFTCIADVIMAALFLYQVISVVWLRAGGYPMSVYTGEFVSSTLPMIFYYAGRNCRGADKGRWYAFFAVSVMMLGILGIVLYATAPQFYCDWAYRWSYISKADAATLRVRMHSVVGSTCLSFLGVAGILAGAYFLASFEDTDGEPAPAVSVPGVLRRRAIAVLIMVICLLTAIMANQRSGLVAAGLAIVFINWLVFFRLDIIPRKYFIYEVVAVVVIFAAIFAVKIEFILKYWYRIISLPTAISQRSEQWVAAVNNMYSSWIGNGLGANGHRAIGFEDAHVIADGGLVKMYCENGVLGFSLFVYLMYLALSDGVKNIRYHYAEVGIIAVGLMQSIGSNMLAFQICAPVFWFAVGACICLKRESKDSCGKFPQHPV